jgi:hypothetical protein
MGDHGKGTGRGYPRGRWRDLWLAPARAGSSMTRGLYAGRESGWLKRRRTVPLVPVIPALRREARPGWASFLGHGNIFKHMVA